MSTTAMPASVAVPAHTAAASNAAVRNVGMFLLVFGVAFVGLAIGAPTVLAAFYELAATAGTLTDMGASSRFGAALFGALTFGWGVTIYQLGAGRDAVRACIVGTLAWFVVDSAASVALGFAWNAVSNLGFVVIVFVLLRTAKARA